MNDELAKQKQKSPEKPKVKPIAKQEEEKKDQSPAKPSPKKTPREIR